jgi:formylmethanofuran dehydrogenase subunit E
LGHAVGCGGGGVVKYKYDEMFFTSRKVALSHLPWLRNEGFTLYTCGRCGVNFASKEASTDFGAIICRVCEREVMEGERRLNSQA